MITHVLDSSAVLAHYFNEPGADEVNSLFADNAAEVGMPAVSLLELKTQLNASVADAREVERAFRLYSGELLAAIPVTGEVAELADGILRNTDGRLTLTEAIAAAIARRDGAVLVHRNRQLARLPNSLLHQHALPFER